MKGSNPVVGDKVLVEAVYNANMPFKWNATRIQVLPMGRNEPPASSGRFSSNYNSVPPPCKDISLLTNLIDIKIVYGHCKEFKLCCYIQCLYILYFIKCSTKQTLLTMFLPTKVSLI